MSNWYLEVQDVSGSRHRIAKKIPFQSIPGSIPGSCIPAFTGTRLMSDL